MSEVLWIRQLDQLLGATALSLAATSGALFTAMGLGALFSARWLARERSPRRALLVLQMLTGVWAVLSPHIDAWLMAAVDGLLTETSATGFVPLHYGVALVGLLVPGVAAGALVPLVADWRARKSRKPGKRVALLWGWDALGSSVFAAATGVVLLRHLGCERSFWVAALLHALVVALVARSGEERTADEPEESSVKDRGRKRRRRERRDEPLSVAPPTLVLMQLALIGLAGVGWQVLWARLLVLALPGALYWPSLLIACWVGCTGLGAVLYRRISALRVDPIATVAVSQILCAAGGWLGGALGSWLRGVLVATRPHAPAALYELLLGLVVSAGAALLAGVMLPAAVDVLRGTRAGTGQATGQVIAADVGGAIVGTMFIPLLLLPWAGLTRSLLLLGAVQLIGGLVVGMWPMAGERGAVRRALAPSVLIALVGAWQLTEADLQPWAPMVDEATGEDERRVVRVVWGAMATAAVVEDPDELRRLYVDRHHGMGGEKGVFIERRQAHIPLVLHGRAKSVAVIGVGTGNTLGAVTQHDVEGIDAAESAISVLQMLDLFSATNNQVWRDERLRVANLDGHTMLRRSPHRYDVIIGDLVHPWRAGAAGLYSREHLRVVRERLAEGGLFCLWLPLHELDEDDLAVALSSFVEVFGEGTALLGHLGWRQPILALVAGGPRRLLERERLAEQLGASTPAHLVDVDIDSPEDLQSLYVGGTEWLRETARGAPVTTLDRPELAYRSSETWWRGVDGLGERMLGAVLDSREPLAERLPDDEVAQRRHRAVGRLLQAELEEAAGDFDEAWRGYEAAARIDPTFNLPRIALELLRRRVGRP